MSFALPSPLTGELLTTGVDIPDFLVGEYTATGLDVPDFLVGEYLSTGVDIPDFLIGEYPTVGVHLPMFLVGDYRNEVTSSKFTTGSAADAQINFFASVSSPATSVSSSLVGWNANAPASSSASIPAPGVAVLRTFPAVSSSASFASTAHSPTIFFEVVASSTTVSGSGAAQRVINATVTASAVYGGAVVGQASYHVSASSMAEIISGIQFVQDFWDGWAFNLSNAAASFYENFKFNSFARIGNEYYGCNDTGIYLLGAELDGADYINATITTGTSDLTTENFNGDNIKSVPYVYISARSPSPMDLTCRVEGQEFTYPFEAGRDVVSTARVSPGKGLFGTFWQFELTNRDGADFEIDSLKVMPHATKRRV